MANTYVDYTGDGSNTDFVFSFPFLEDSHVVVEVDGVDKTIAGGDFTLPTTSLVRMTTAPNNLSAVRVKRVSDFGTNLVDFVNGSVLNEADLDKAYLHNRYLNEEAAEGNDASMQIVGGGTDFNAANKKIVNLATPTVGTDAANKNYIDDRVALGSTNLNAFDKSTHTGDNTETQFTLSFTSQSDTAEAYLVTIDGVVQIPTTAYSVSTSTNKITFTSAPPTSANIVVVPIGTTSSASDATVTQAGTTTSKTLANWTNDLQSATATGSTQSRSLADRFGDVVNLLDYGTVDTPANTSSTFSAAITAASSGSILIPDGTYTIASPIRASKAIKLLGKSVRIIADSSFTGIDFTDGGGTTTLKALLIFNPTSEINTTSGTREFGAFVDDGISLDCNYDSGTSTAAADYGLFVERMPRSKFMCDVDGANQDGIRINHYCWGVELSNNSVSSSGEAGIVLNKAFNGGVINNPRIFRGDTGVSPKFGIKVSTGTSDNNGITIQGGYIQDMLGTGSNDGHALFFDSRCGPVFVSGIDIENINGGGNCVYAVGDYASNRVAGPITITGSYLQANTGSIIYASQYYVNVANCRFREPTGGGATYKRFETPGGTDNGVIVAVNNEYETTGATIVDGSNVLVQQRKIGTNQTFNYISTRSVDYSDDYSVYNYAFRDDPSRESGKLKFTNSYQGGVNERYISKAVLSASDYKHATGSYSTMSVEADSVSNSFSPTTDNIHDLGSSSLRWKDVYASNATIQTSDKNQKEQIEELNEQEKTVAVNCKSLIRRFKWKDAVLEKGTDARFHFGIIAQDLEKAFSDGGLDARAYGIFIEAKWWEDSEGNRVTEDLEGAVEKSMLGVRYNELLAFIISAL